MALVTDVSTTPLSGLNHIDALLANGPGWTWLVPARNIIYYTFSVTSGNEVGNSSIAGGVSAFNAAQQSACLSQLSYISQLTGITFSVATTGASADLHFAATNITSSASTSGLCSWSHGWSYNSNNVVTSYTADAYVYLDNVEWVAQNGAPVAGSQGYESLLHELGHALGLKHPFEGGNRLPTAADNTANSIMSYTESGGPYTVFSPYDVAALMWIYGGDGLGGTLGVSTLGKYIVGSATTDLINGGNGNDKLKGLAGNDAINGGAGGDTAVYTDNRTSYAITATADGFNVTSSTDGSDTLTNVERLQFSDTKIALDLGGNAGTTAKILGAVFGAASVSNKEYVGIGLSLLDGGMSYADLVQLALNAKLGTGFSNAAEVNLVYQNLVGVLPPTNELDYWTGTLNSGQYTQASLAVMAAELDLNKGNIDLVGLAQAGIEYS